MDKMCDEKFLALYPVSSASCSCMLNKPILCHVYILKAGDYEWDTLEWKRLKPRYEHCTFVTESNPHTLWVFGGAQQSGNHNCLQSIDLNGKSCFMFF